MTSTQTLKELPSFLSCQYTSYLYKQKYKNAKQTLVLSLSGTSKDSELTQPLSSYQHFNHSFFFFLNVNNNNDALM